MKEVTFIYPNDLKIVIGVYPPLGISYLASYLIEKGYRAAVIDLTFDSEDWGKSLKRGAGIYSISYTTTLSRLALKAAEKIKNANKDNIIIAGGPHPSMLPEETIKSPLIDYIISGEGEEALYELCEAIYGNGKVSSVKGAYYKEGNEIKKTAERKEYVEIDKLPFPRQDLFPLEKYFAGRYIRELSIISSRGCYGDCTFCQPCLRTIFGNKMRIRSAKNVVDEIEEMQKRYGVDLIVFSDDVFGLKSHTEAICKEIIKRKINVFWRCQARVGVDKDTLKLMKRAGCVAVSFGVESGDQRILNNIRKFTTTDKIIETFRECRNIGIFTNANLMVGNIGETKESVENTCGLLKRIRPFSLSVTITTPFPGTHLYEEAKKRGYIKKNFSWDELSYTKDNTYHLDIPSMSEEEVVLSKRLVQNEFNRLGTLNRLGYVIAYIKDPSAVLKVIKFAIKKPRVMFRFLKLIISTAKSGLGISFANPKRTREMGGV